MSCMPLRWFEAAARLLAGVTAPGRRRLTARGAGTAADQEPAGSMLFATHVTRRPVHGEPTVLSPGPELPPAATTLQPRRTALSAAMEGTASGPPEPPRLMLMTCAIGFGKPVTVREETESSMAIVMAAETQPPTGAAWPAMEPASLQTL